MESWIIHRWLNYCLLIVFCVGLWVDRVHASNWVWTGSSGNWSTNSNWSPASRPTSSTVGDIQFNNGTAANNDLGTFTLNRLTFNSLLSSPFNMTGNDINFSGTTSSLTMNSNFDVTVNNNIILNTNTVFGGSGRGILTLSGIMSGGGVTTFSAGNYILSNQSNTFSGGLNVAGANVMVNRTTTSSTAWGSGGINVRSGSLFINSTVNLSTSSLLGNISGGMQTVSVVGNLNLNTGSGANISGGGVLNLITTGTGSMNGNTFTFGSGGGMVNFFLQGGGSQYGIGNIVLNNGTQEAIISNSVMNTDPSAGAWVSSYPLSDAKYLGIYQGTVSGSGNLTLNMTNGALAVLYHNKYEGALTFQGVQNGDAAAGSTATNVGRFALVTNTFTAGGGFFFKNANQITTFSGGALLDSNMTIVNGETAFYGRTTSSSVVVQNNRLCLGSNSGQTLTIKNGAIATMDMGFRTDTFPKTFAGVIVNATTLIEGGGILQFKNTVFNSGGMYDNIVINGDVRGTGTEKMGESTILFQDSIGGVIDTDTGSRNVVFPVATNLYVEGSGLNGLRVEGLSTHVDGVLTSDRLRSHVLSAGKDDQGTFTIAYTDDAKRVFTADDGPMEASWIKLGFDTVKGANPNYILDEQGSKGSGGSLGNWNGLVIKGGTVTVVSDLTMQGASGNPNFYLVGGTLHLASGVLSFDGINGGSAELRSGVISGGIDGGTLSVKGNLVKTTDGVVTIGGKITTSSKSATLDIQGGTIIMGAANIISDKINIKLSGSGSKLNLNGFSQTLGTLTLSSTSTIDFGAGAVILNFANSSGQIWDGKANLYITNFNNNEDQLSFGTGGLTNSQIAQIWFQDPNNTNNWYRGMMDSRGRVRPIPEASTIWAGVLLVVVSLVHQFNRRRR